MNKIKIIKIDIDGVVRNFVKGVYQSLKMQGFNCPETEPFVENWDISKYYPEVQNFYNKVFHDVRSVSRIFGPTAYNYPEYYQLPIIIREMFKKHLVIFQSHQNELTAKYTREYILINFPDFSVVCHDSKIEKSVIPGILIDDKPSNILDNGLDRSILIARPWNENFRNQNVELKIAHNQIEVIRHLKSILGGN